MALSSSQVLDREYLEIRARVLELAACFDRLERAAGDVTGDPRISLLHQALQTVQSDEGDRAERVQLIFSRIYEEDWRSQFGI